ncbi:DDE-type integrase/transposase/recombinase [Methylobacterium aquaticum]|uniref:DDE-type integrase/transposase/recombinase n=1 Tax=Methylobacterium aquaticum TaxID=270351 RepID=UPI003D16B7BA
MKEWLTAKELAAEKLPDVPATIKGVLNLAEREGWNTDPYRARRRSGRGGGMEYNIGLLPTLAQVHYRQRAMASIGSAPQPELRPTAALSGRAALERDARLAILQAYKTFARGQRLNQQGCEQLFLAKYQAGTFAIEKWVTDLIPSFSRRTLARWRAEADANPDGLAHDPGAARKGTGMLDTANEGAVRRFVLALVAHQPHLSARQIRNDCRAEFGETVAVRRGGGVVETVPLPPLRTFQAALKEWKEAEKVPLTRITNPDKYRSTMRLSGTNSLAHIDQPNMLWQIDASPVDALCTDGRHSIYVCVDIASRRAIFYMSRTPRAEAVGLLMRKAILAWGVPAQVKTDNGSDFAAKATQRLLASLGIEAIASDPFSPEQKGHVERLIGTFQRDAVPILPGFIGHSVADRKAIEGRKSFARRLGDDDAEIFSVQCTAAEMMEHFDLWAEHDYGQRPHEGLGRRSPAAVAAASGHTIRRVDVRALDLLLAPMPKGDGTRVITKKGIRVDGLPYHNGAIRVGTRVFVRFDPLDLGRVYLFDTEDGGFLGEATNATMAGISPDEHIRAQRALQAEDNATLDKQIDAERKKLRKSPGRHVRYRQVVERDRAERERAAADVLPFPRPEVEHTTPQIAAALDAATRRERVPAAELSDRAAEMHAGMLAGAAPPALPDNVTRLRNHETKEMRFRRALDFEARIAAGDALTTDEALWLGGYQAGSEYRGLSKVYAKFGEQMSF